MTRSTYRELNLPAIRRWREITEQRVPDQFQTVIADRDAVMAGHLHALAEQDEGETIVAAVGVQHLTGVLDLLRDPASIPDDLIENPPVVDYQLFPRDSPYSSASSTQPGGIR
ncbi:TraB/GumN family protein [Halolamina salina]|uniref:TraB/GumN family protein n=1 Tax=Halolamina salina TaxID=1220023 RepID=A0ABD6BAM8_9EURY